LLAIEKAFVPVVECPYLPPRIVGHFSEEEKGYAAFLSFLVILHQGVSWPHLMAPSYDQPPFFPPRSLCKRSHIPSFPPPQLVVLNRGILSLHTFLFFGFLREYGFPQDSERGLSPLFPSVDLPPPPPFQPPKKSDVPGFHFHYFLLVSPARTFPPANLSHPPDQVCGEFTVFP